MFSADDALLGCRPRKTSCTNAVKLKAKKIRETTLVHALMYDMPAWDQPNILQTRQVGSCAKTVLSGERSVHVPSDWDIWPRVGDPVNRVSEVGLVPRNLGSRYLKSDELRSPCCDPCKALILRSRVGIITALTWGSEHVGCYALWLKAIAVVWALSWCAHVRRGRWLL
jgi:hypothetical protein